MNIHVIVNPSAAGGSTRQKIPQLKRLLERRGVSATMTQTERAGHATELAREALTSAVDVLAVMGGDGSFNEVAQAYLDEAGRPVCGPALCLIPAGTGGDSRRTFDLPESLDAAVERMLGGGRLPVDLGRTTTTVLGCPRHYAFLNVASVGVSARVSQLANDGSKWAGGKLTFYSAALRATLGYRNLELAIAVDGQPFYVGRTYLAAFANGRYFGGGMRIAPHARADDGLLDVIVLGDYSKLGAVGLSRAIYAGTHLSRSRTHVTRGRCIEVSALGSGAGSAALGVLETDGEVPEARLPIAVVVFASALQLCV